MDLTRKQEAFIFEYLKDFNATQAAKRSGYGPKSAEVTGHRLLRNAKISAEIERRKEKLSNELRQMFISDAIKARQVMLDILNDPNSSDRDKIAVAKDVLDRSGFKPIEKKELSGAKGEAIQIVFIDPSQ